MRRLRDFLPAPMLDFRERSRFRRLFYSTPSVVILVVIAGFLAHASWTMYEKSVQAGERRDKVLGELAALEARKVQLDADIGKLSTDRGIEAEIRDRFMVAKEGEKVIIITDPSEDEEIIVGGIKEDRSGFQAFKSWIGIE
ncbi:MAG TPA: hypothetical protein VLB83_00635 [Candidatus Paceibacterota bacterium]|nr:hypothetical protein [Candidatus Paceibacterota bacterium]